MRVVKSTPYSGNCRTTPQPLWLRKPDQAGHVHKRKVLHRSERHGNQSHPRIEEAWGPNTLASHNPKPKQTKQLPTSLPPFAVMLGSLPGERAFFLLGQALELRHAQPLWKGYRKSKEGCYHAIGVPQGSSPAAKPFGLTVLQAPTKLYQ